MLVELSAEWWENDLAEKMVEKTVVQTVEK